MLAELALIIIAAVAIALLLSLRRQTRNLLAALESLSERGFVGRGGLRVRDPELRQFWERWNRTFRMRHQTKDKSSPRESLLNGSAKGSAEISEQIVNYFLNLSPDSECSILIEDEGGESRVLHSSGTPRYRLALESPVRSLTAFSIISEETHTLEPGLSIHLAFRGVAPAGYTERKEAAARQLSALSEALESEKSKRIQEGERRALIGVSHDLRQPSLIALAKLKERRERLPEIEALLSEQLDLISDVLDYERATLGTLRARPQSVTIRTITDELTALYSASAEISSNCDDTSVYVDRKQLKRILGNLLSNAVRAGDTIDSKVRVVFALSSLPDGALELTVTDNGRGVPTEIAKNLFKPTEGELVEKGLGLSICRILAELNGLTLSYREAPVKGSCFSIIFPKELIITQNEPHTLTEPSSVLIAEDDEATARFYTRTVQALGHIPIRVNSRAEVRSYLGSGRKLGALFTDLSLSDGEITEDLLEHAANLPPTLVVSGYDDLDERLVKLGVSFIQKPAEVSEISKSLRELISV